MKPIPYSKACTAVKHLLPDGCRFLKIGEPIPAGARYLDELGFIKVNTIGATKLMAIHHPHFVEIETETVTDKILKAFTDRIDDLKRDAKRYAEAGEYETAGKIATRINALDEALGIAMRVVRS